LDLEIRVDRNRCIGSGQCVHWAPGVFSQDEEAISIVVDPRGEPEEKIVAAVVRCPVGAISLRIDDIGVDAQHSGENWHRGSLVDSPIVPLLEMLGDDHAELRASLQTLRRAIAGELDAVERDDGDAWDALVLDFAESLSAHNAREQEIAYPAITALIGSRLVEAFDRDHAMTGEMARTLSGLASQDPANMTAAVTKLAW
jgi:ferredoxin